MRHRVGARLGHRQSTRGPRRTSLDSNWLTTSRGTAVIWLDFVLAWLLLGFVNYGIKFLKYRNDWKKAGNRVFFVAVLVGALVFGPIGLLVTLVRSRGNPFKTVPTSKK